MYLDLQLAMLVSTDCSIAIASSCVDNGLYHMVRRSISLAWRHRMNKNHRNRFINTDKTLVRFVFAAWKGSRRMKIPVKPVKVSDVSCSTCEAENLCCFFWIILKDNTKNNWVMHDGRQLRLFPLSMGLFVHGMFFYFFPPSNKCIFYAHTTDHLNLTLHVCFTWFFGYGGHPRRERVSVDPSLCDLLPLAHSCIKTASALRHCDYRQAVHRHVLWV